MNRRITAIQQSLPIVAKAIGRACDVKVAVGGSRAYTDGETIHLPDLPFHDPEIETLAFGYLEHEAAHVRYTEAVECSSPLHHALWNILEDVRIEARLGGEYPGFAATLKQLVRRLVDDDVLRAPAPESQPPELLQSYLLYRLRREVLGQDALADHAHAAEGLFRERFPEGVATRIGAVIGRARRLRSSRETAELAAEIVAILEDEKAQFAAEPDPGSEPGTGDGAGDGTDAPAGPSSSGGELSEKAKDAKRLSALEATLEATEAELAPGFGQTVAGALEAAAEDAARTKGALTAGVGQATEPLSPGVGDASALLQEVNSATTALRTRLRSFVEASRRRHRGHRLRGARLDDRRLVNALTGDPRVYRQQSKEKAVNTALVVLLDRSSSMKNEDRIGVARQSTLATVAALEPVLGLSLCAAVFPGYKADVEILSRFDQSVRRTATRYGSVAASGGTPLLPALFWAVDALLGQPQPRKMLLVVTDGQPFEPEACREAIRRCWIGGVEVYGLGIKVPDMEALFPISRCIDDVAELAGAMFGMLQKALTSRRLI